jgi:alpha-1,2-mannosyltransferase
MFLYSRALRHAEFVMANSTWTKNHVDSILKYNDTMMETPVIALQVLYTPFNMLASWILPSLSLHAHADPTEALRVYPSCDTRAMAEFPLENRERIILSIAQFRYVDAIFC